LGKKAMLLLLLLYKLASTVLFSGLQRFKIGVLATYLMLALQDLALQ